MTRLKKMEEKKKKHDLPISIVYATYVSTQRNKIRTIKSSNSEVESESAERAR